MQECAIVKYNKLIEFKWRRVTMKKLLAVVAAAALGL